MNTFDIIARFEKGFVFTSQVTSYLTEIQLSLQSFGYIYRFLRFKIREGSGLSGKLLYSGSIVFPYSLNKNYTPNIVCLSISGKVEIIANNLYTLTLKDYTEQLVTYESYTLYPQNSTGFMRYYGCETDGINYIAYNTNVYPNMNFVYKQKYNTTEVIFVQPSSSSSSLITSSNESGFVFTPKQTGYFNSYSILLNIATATSKDFTFRIRQGSGLYGSILYEDTQSTSLSGDVTLSSTLSSPTDYYVYLQENKNYTFTIQQISGTYSTVSIKGSSSIYTPDLYFNSSVYANFDIGIKYKLLNNTLQPSILTISNIISTTEQGFVITPSSNGYLQSIVMSITSFQWSGFLQSRTINLKIREGTSLSGPIIYSSDYIVYTELELIEYVFIISSQVNVLSTSSYTVTLQDVTTYPSYVDLGFIEVYGIYGNNTYTTLDSSVFPKSKYFVDTVYSSIAFEQQKNPTIYEELNDVEKSFSFTSPYTGVVSVLKLSLTSVDGIELKVNVRQGLNLIYTIDTTCPRSLTRSYLQIPIGTGFNVVKGESYTISFTDKNYSYEFLTDNNIYGIYGSFIPKIFLGIPSYVITISPPAPLSGFLGSQLDTIEFNTSAKDNVNVLSTANLPPTRSQYYAIGLKHLILPNKILNISSGGALDNYPYIYVQIYNDGNRGSLQVMNSTNPNSKRATFKVQINKYLYNIPTSFFTLKPSGPDQIILFRPDQDIRLTITLPDGTILSYADQESFSPLAPNPFIQISALFSLRPLEEYTSTYQNYLSGLVSLRELTLKQSSL